MYGIWLTVRTDTSGDADAPIDAALGIAFPSDKEGLVWINAATDGRQFAEQVARVVWTASGGYCALSIEIDWSAAMPDGDVESFHFGREDYQRMTNELPPEEAE